MNNWWAQSPIGGFLFMCGAIVAAFLMRSLLHIGLCG